MRVANEATNALRRDLSSFFQASESKAEIRVRRQAEEMSTTIQPQEVSRVKRGAATTSEPLATTLVLHHSIDTSGGRKMRL